MFRAIVARAATCRYRALAAAVVVPLIGTLRATAQSTEAPVAPAAPQRVVLAAEKLAHADIQIEPAQRRTLQQLRTAPGRLRYDDRRHVEVKTAAAGIVAEIRVKPGDRVAAGDVLAVLTSPEVGSARADWLELAADRDIAARTQRHCRAIHEGLGELVAQVNQGAEPQAIARTVERLQLGEYRAEVLSTYAAFRLAERLQGTAAAGGASGALSGRQVDERQSQFVAAQSALGSAIQDAEFHAELACAEADARVADADRRVAIAAQYVAALTGVEAAAAADVDVAALTQLQLVAPLGGTIESRRFSASERVAPGDSLFVLADTSQLWVEVDIREGEWGALAIEPGQKLAVTGPTLGEAALEAEVHYVGREVSVETNAVPIVAMIANPRGALRPGQFVEVRAPIGAPREALAVRASALVEHEGKSFVFVAESAGTYRRVDVGVGISDGAWVEVREGLAEGAPVVVAGAFALKSELLLEREE
jgi:cobalt-zinc-cadmium efflux system membrane fusion protein